MNPNGQEEMIRRIIALSRTCTLGCNSNGKVLTENGKEILYREREREKREKGKKEREREK